MNEFTKNIYETVKKIPTGKVMSYGDVAIASGKPRGARAVGYALHRNPEPYIIPCHRVVFNDGSLTDGFAFGGIGEQKRLLKEENVIFLENGKVDMKLCRFIFE